MCNDSRELGHYRTSKDAKNDFEPTGSRKVGLFCDLANTQKILKETEDTERYFYHASSYYGLNGNDHPVGSIRYVHAYDRYHCTVGWLVMDV